MLQWVKRHAILAYIVLAYAITWLCWLPTLLIGQRQGYLLPFADSYLELAQTGFLHFQHLAVSVVFALGVYGPLVAAFITVWAAQGQIDVIALMGRMVKWRVSIQWYIVVGLVNLGMLGVSIGVGVVTGGIGLNGIRFMSLSHLGLMFLAQVVTSGLGEEPGWRGYLLPQLQARHEGGKAIWLLGLIWAAWHYPFIIFFTWSAASEAPAIQVAVAIIASLAGHTMTVIGMAFIYAWIYNRTRSVFLAMLLHALNNLVPHTLVGGMTTTMILAMALVPWAFVIVMERVNGKAWFLSGSNDSAVKLLPTAKEGGVR